MQSTTAGYSGLARRVRVAVITAIVVIGAVAPKAVRAQAAPVLPRAHALHAPLAADVTGAGLAGQSRWLEGAIAGAVVGGAATWMVIHSGGSTSLCDRDANQDAIRAPECAAITAGGAVVGALIGGFIGSRIRTSARTQHVPVDGLRMHVAPLRGGVRMGVMAPAR